MLFMHEQTITIFKRSKKLINDLNKKTQETQRIKKEIVLKGKG